MDKESKVCMGCPVRESCPPQKRADRINRGIDQGTMSLEQASSGLSMLRQDIYKNHCPVSERRLLVDPLLKRIHPGRQPFSYGSGPRATTPDTIYKEYMQGKLHNKRRKLRA